MQNYGSRQLGAEPFTKIIALSLKCLTEYANVRISSFSHLEAKNVFVGNFVQHLVQLLNHSCTSSQD